MSCSRKLLGQEKTGLCVSYDSNERSGDVGIMQHVCKKKKRVVDMASGRVNEEGETIRKMPEARIIKECSGKTSFVLTWLLYQTGKAAWALVSALSFICLWPEDT